MFEFLDSFLATTGMKGIDRSELLNQAAGGASGMGRVKYNMTNTTPGAIQYQTAVTNNFRAYQKQLNDYWAEISNINASNKEAQNQYQYKSAQLASDLEYNQASLDALPGIYDTKRSYMEQLMNNSQQEYDIENQLLNKKYAKQEGDVIGKWAASGFGSIGMSEALARDVQSQKAIQADLLRTQNDANIIKQKFQLSDLANEQTTVTAEAEKKVADVKLAQQYNMAPIARKYGAAPAFQTVANPNNYGA